MPSFPGLVPRGEWGGRWDSNPRRPDPQSGALPTELRPPLLLLDSRYRQRAKLVPMARLAGLEPATTGLEGRCSIRLSYRRIVWLHQLRAGSQRFGRGKRI